MAHTNRFAVIAIAVCAAATTVGAQPAGPERESDDETVTVTLPAPDTAGSVTVERAISERRSVRQYAPGALTVAELGQLLYAAQGVTETRTGYRASPSAGATFPLELYAAVGDVDGLSAGLYRYVPASHELVSVSADDVRAALHDAALRQPMVRDAPVVLVMTGVTARTAGRYGERAERYVAMEAGHASQNVYLQATALGLGTVAVGAFDDRSIGQVLGVSADEQPLYLMPVGRRE
ncbi:MAG: SagB/ThcOx family dehydrogenase [Spirochaetaceae bacterium]|nr:MAG: SagB/ThcOx family dehydrogenase [Spirochaetaceae bacterium]